MKYIEEKFLLKLYRELYKEKSVIHSGDKSDNKFEMIHKYLKRLESSEKVYDRDKKSALEYLKNRYYEKYVIKEENIKDKSSKDFIINKQKESLSNCLNYLLGDKDARKFPVWVRYWAFQGIVKMGTYNGETNSYAYRTDKTTSSFLILNELNMRSLNETMQMMIDFLGNRLDNSDENLKHLVENGKFSTLFSYNRWKNIDYMNKNTYITSDGIWKSYPKNSDISELQNAVDKNVTHWCIEDPAVMKEYNTSSDFEVYYTKDQNGLYSVPKIAIVIKDGYVKEIRGVFDPHENIDGNLVPIVEEKLATFKHDSSFDERLNNVKKMNVIENKHLNEIDLTKDELKFLYEVEDKIYTLGRDTGSEFRVNNIKRERDKKSDYAKMFDCTKEQVGDSFEEFCDIDKDLVVYLGDIEIEREKLPLFSCPKYIFGKLECPYISDANGFEKLEEVYGDVICDYLINPDGFANLSVIHGDAIFPNLDKELRNLKFVGGNSKFKTLNSEGISR